MNQFKNKTKNKIKWRIEVNLNPLNMPDRRTDRHGKEINRKKLPHMAHNISELEVKRDGANRPKV